jgi:cytochrome c oxidase assembly factor CtaG
MIPISQLPSAWDPAPLVVAGAAVAGLRFAYAFRRLRRRGRFDHAGWDRALLFAAGLALVTLPLVSPLDAAGDDYLLSAHMLQHVLLGDAGPALILAAVRGPLLAFMLPPAIVRFVFRNGPIRALLGWLSRPLPALAVWGVALGVWHVPRLYDGALRHPWAHDLEHASFLAAGIVVWMQLIDPARTGRLTVGKRIAFAGAVFLLGQVLSDLLFLSSTPLYPAYADRSVRLFGLSPLSDQQYAGLVMMAEQIVTLGSCVLILGASALRAVPRPAGLAPT